MRANLNWKSANEMVADRSLDRVRKAAEVIADRTRQNVPVGTVSRPVYKSGPLAGVRYTAREAGSLKKTIRVTELDEEKYGYAFKEFGFKKGIVRVYAGDFLAYYARIVEYYRPFMRPAIESSMGEVRSIIENG